MLNCKTKVTKIYYLCKNTFTLRTQFMALFFEGEILLSLFSLKLFQNAALGCTLLFSSFRPHQSSWQMEKSWYDTRAMSVPGQLTWWMTPGCMPPCCLSYYYNRKHFQKLHLSSCHNSWLTYLASQKKINKSLPLRWSVWATWYITCGRQCKAMFILRKIPGRFQLSA